MITIISLMIFTAGFYAGKFYERKKSQILKWMPWKKNGTL